MVLTNYGGNLSEAKQAGQDFKIGRDFSIGNHHHLLQQIDNFVAASVRGDKVSKGSVSILLTLRFRASLSCSQPKGRFDSLALGPKLPSRRDNDFCNGVLARINPR